MKVKFRIREKIEGISRTQWSGVKASTTDEPRGILDTYRDPRVLDLVVGPRPQRTASRKLMVILAEAAHRTLEFFVYYYTNLDMICRHYPLFHIKHTHQN